MPDIDQGLWDLEKMSNEICPYCNKPVGPWDGLLNSQVCQCPEPEFQCCKCEKELAFTDVRVEVPEFNEVWCPECFYKNHKIIT